MEHQDWETFVIHCKTPKNDKTTKETKHHEKTKDRKIEEMEEKGVLTHKKVETSLSKIIQQARVEKGWTQKELANKVAGISTTKLGAGDAMPFIKDLS